MLTETKKKLLDDLVSEASHDELIWINGFLAGLSRAPHNGVVSPVDLVPKDLSLAQKKITLLYATETGNTKRLASEFSLLSKGRNIKLKSSSMEQYRVVDLENEETIFFITSTHGEGEPPKMARKIFDYLAGTSPSLAKLRFAILALGDLSYPLFCKAGDDLELLLKQCGAKPLLPVQKCDVDYKAQATAWFESAVLSISTEPGTTSNKKSHTSESPAKGHLVGRIVKQVNLNGRGSLKRTHHLEIRCDEAIQYEPGDAVGLVPHNKTEVVNTVFELSGFDPNRIVHHPRIQARAIDLLLYHLNIAYVPGRVVNKYATIVQQEIPASGIDLVNLLRIYPLRDKEQFEEVIIALEPITPRLYSIASSPASHENEVHLTVGLHCFNTEKGRQLGLCSSWLTGLNEGDDVSFTIRKNFAFKLPEDNRDIIMIGPGTGIAPFRSFISERETNNASGRSWLFFGDQHFTTDFLYQVELQEWLNNGSLSRLSLAFSRDQEEKQYVQHKLRDEAAELATWIKGGGVVYVCGAKTMADDVENELNSIIRQHWNVGESEANSILLKMKESGTYQVDVY